MSLERFGNGAQQNSPPLCSPYRRPELASAPLAKSEFREVSNEAGCLGTFSSTPGASPSASVSPALGG